MKKSIFGLLLAICLIVGLLPVVASAESNPADAEIRFAFTTYKLTAFDTPIYTVNASKETQDTAGNKFIKWEQTTAGANEDNYNAKFFWKTGDEAPTLILRGFKFDEWNNETEKMEAKYDSNTEAYTEESRQTYPITLGNKTPMNIIITGEDSLIEGQFGITYRSNTTIKSEGNAKLVINSRTGCIVSADTAGAALTIDANLTLNTATYYNMAYGGSVLRTYKADLTINGGTIIAKSTANKSVAGIAAQSGGNVIINGGTITAHGVAGTSPTNGSIQATAGKVIINGGTVKATAAAAVPIYAVQGVEINGGYVDILSPYYGINAGNTDNPADIKINGGTLKIIAERACYKAPILGDGVSGFVGASEKSAEIYDPSDANASKRPWMLITNNPKHMIEITEPSEETVPIFTMPSTEPTVAPSTTPSTPATTPSTPTTPAGTQATTNSGSTDDTKAPSGENTGDKTEDDADEGGSNLILWIVVGVVAAGAIAAVVIIVLKRKKA